MSLVPTIYESTDPGAPQLTGQEGSLTAILDAVLVAGYGDGAARKDGAGWTREYTGTNVRAYRGSVATGSGYYLRVDDSAAVGNARHAWIRGYERMSGIGDGENPVPSISQRANGALVPKSISLDAVARRWRVIANERFIYMFVATANRVLFYPWFAGDCVSYKPGDAHHFVVSAADALTWTGGFVWSPKLLTNGSYVTNAVSSSCGMFIARSHTGEVGPLPCDHFGTIQSATFGGSNGGAYPSGINQGLFYEPARFHNGAYLPRGELPGLYSPMQTLVDVPAFADGTFLEGVEGEGSDRLLVTHFSRALDVTNSVSYRGVVLIRTDSEWDA